MMTRVSYGVIGLLALTLLGGCAPYVEDFHYAPHPAIVEIQTATTQPAQSSPPPVTAYATVIGIRRPDAHHDLPLSVEVRLRLENHGPAAVTFDPQSLDLTTGDLLRFPPPIIPPPQAIPVQMGQSVMIQANFPFPPGASYGNMNLQTLDLRWTVNIDGHAVAQTAQFHRVAHYYYDPYWGYPYAYPYPYYGYPYYGFGGAIIIRR